MKTPNPEIDSDLIFYTHKACLGEIRPNMRRISTEYIREKKTILLRIFYDKPLTQEEKDHDIGGTILAKLMNDFPQKLEWKSEISVLPYPARMSSDKGLCIYEKYEPMPDSERESN